MSFPTGVEVIGTEHWMVKGHRGTVIGLGDDDDNVLVRFIVPAFAASLKEIANGRGDHYEDGDVVDKYTGLVWTGFLAHIPVLQLLAESAE